MSVLSAACLQCPLCRMSVLSVFYCLLLRLLCFVCSFHVSFLLLRGALFSNLSGRCFLSCRTRAMNCLSSLYSSWIKHVKYTRFNLNQSIVPMACFLQYPLALHLSNCSMLSVHDPSTLPPANCTCPLPNLTDPSPHVLHKVACAIVPHLRATEAGCYSFHHRVKFHAVQ